MRRTRFNDRPCPIARVTDLIGDWWTPLVMRDALLGIRRFEAFQESLGIPRAVLAARLKRLCDEGMLTKVPYQEAPVRHEYRLTDQGREFFSVIAAMWRWSDDWLYPEGGGAPIALRDRETGEVIRPVVVDERTGEPVDVRRVRVGRPG